MIGPQPVTAKAQHDAGIQVGKAVLGRIPKAMRLPELAFPSVSGIRHLMIKQLWSKHSFQMLDRLEVDPLHNGVTMMW